MRLKRRLLMLDRLYVVTASVETCDGGAGRRQDAGCALADGERPGAWHEPGGHNGPRLDYWLHAGSAAATDPFVAVAARRRVMGPDMTLTQDYNRRGRKVYVGTTLTSG